MFVNAWSPGDVGSSLEPQNKQQPFFKDQLQKMILTELRLFGLGLGFLELI